MKTQYCDTCKYWKDSKPCIKGHKPRFHVPQTYSDIFRGNWGYKKRCIDFEKVIYENNQ